MIQNNNLEELSIEEIDKLILKTKETIKKLQIELIEKTDYLEKIKNP